MICLWNQQSLKWAKDRRYSMNPNQNLLDNIIRFDQTLREFAEQHPEEFNLHLEFPAVARQQSNHEDPIGYLQETLYYTALAMNCLDEMPSPEAKDQLAQTIAPVLNRNINEFLDAEAKARTPLLDKESRTLCMELATQFQKLNTGKP